MRIKSSTNFRKHTSLLLVALQLAAVSPVVAGELCRDLMSLRLADQLHFLAKQGRNGAWYLDQEGSKWYLKADEIYPELQTAGEVISSSIYRELGYLAPVTKIVHLGGVRYSAAKEIGVGGTLSIRLHLINSSEFRQMRVIASFLKDWDRLQSRNSFDLGENRFASIDFGGSLGARARGTHKPGPVVSDAIGAFENTRNIQEIYDAYRVDVLPADHPWQKLTLEDAALVIEKLKRLTNEKIDFIVANAQYSNPADAAYMKSALKNRRDGIIQNLLGHLEKK